MFGRGGQYCCHRTAFLFGKQQGQYCYFHPRAHVCTATDHYGKIRLLGFSTVVERWVKQALGQVLMTQPSIEQYSFRGSGQGTGQEKPEVHPKS